MSTAQSLQIIADVTVSVSAAGALPPAFNQGLITGTSTAIPSYGANSRARQYTAANYATQMLTDGFTVSSAEYIAAQMYFSQSPQPYAVWIGRQDATAIQTITIASGEGGAGWKVGDQFTITQSGGSYGVGQVLTVSAGAVLTVAVVFGSQGTGYAVANGLTATAILPSVGTGLEIDITAVGETCLQAIQYCRTASQGWWCCMATAAADADHLAVSAWALTQTGTAYFCTNGEAAVINGYSTESTTGTATSGSTSLSVVSATNIIDGQFVAGAGIAPYTTVTNVSGTTITLSAPTTAALSVTPVTFSGNVLALLYGANSKRTWLQYATTQSGLYPNQIYFVAAVMGQAMASNTQAPNSAFTEKFSGGVPLVGVYTEPNPTNPNAPLTSSQITNVEQYGGNLFLNYANSYSILEQGTMCAPSVYMDQILNLDILAANIQYNVMNLLTSVPKIPQTNAGQLQLIQAVEAALAVAANVGFIAGGVWEGPTILNLTAGNALPSGYKVQSPPYSQQSSANRQARQAMPIYVSIITAGAVNFVTIQVNVQV
jgi:Protein of unknown function (DUF3383)